MAVNRREVSEADYVSCVVQQYGFLVEVDEDQARRELANKVGEIRECYFHNVSVDACAASFR